MFQDVANPTSSEPTSFWDGCFNERMDTLIARNHRRQVRLQRLSASSTMKMIDDVRGRLPLADRAQVARMLEKNPEIVRSVALPGQSESVGIFAYLPLNPYGAWALMTGRYDGIIWPLLRGHVRLDGADLAHWRSDAIGQHIGYLAQEVSLMDATIQENICRFDPDPGFQKVIAAAKAAGVHEMILKMPEGYGTKLGPSGAALSGGQQQRVALARA